MACRLACTQYVVSIYYENSFALVTRNEMDLGLHKTDWVWYGVVFSSGFFSIFVRIWGMFLFEADVRGLVRGVGWVVVVVEEK